MKFTTINEVNEFLRTVEECRGQVWLESIHGDKIVLNSVLSHYIAMSMLLTQQGEILELFCQLPEDEAKFFKYFNKFPGTV